MGTVLLPNCFLCGKTIRLPLTNVSYAHGLPAHTPCYEATIRKLRAERFEKAERELDGSDWHGGSNG